MAKTVNNPQKAAVLIFVRKESSLLAGLCPAGMRDFEGESTSDSRSLLLLKATSLGRKGSRSVSRGAPGRHPG